MNTTFNILPFNSSAEARRITEAESLDAGAWAITSKFLLDFKRAAPGDDCELIQDRFLCRGGGLLLVGPTGIGKSSLAMTLMAGFALGRTTLGIRPTRSLTSLLIQAENDESDLAEMRDGVVYSLNLTPGERRQVGYKVQVVTENSMSGGLLISAMHSVFKKFKPDLLWIDPAFAYIDGDSNRAEDVGKFLRRYLNPLLTEYGCAAVIVHHTPKPSNGVKGKGNGNGMNAYAGAGSAEWANWARAVLTLEPVGRGFFNLHNTKRPRLNWTDEFGNPCYAKALKHRSKDGVFWWEEADSEEAERAAMAQQDDVPDLASVVVGGVRQHDPIQKDQLEEYCRKQKIGEKKFARILRTLVDKTPPLLHEWKIKRTGGKGGRDLVYISRAPQPQGIGTREDLEKYCNHGGHFNEARMKEIDTPLRAALGVSA